MSRRNVYSHVGGLFPGRTTFDLSYEKKIHLRHGATYSRYV